MSLSASEIGRLLPEVREKVCPGRLEQVYQIGDTDIVWKLRKEGETHHLLVSSHPARSRLHITTRPFEAPADPTPFCKALRKHLRGGRLVEVEQMGGDRVVRFRFEVNPGPLEFVAEIMGRGSHLLLVDAPGEILAALRPYRGRHRSLVPGEPYHPPEPPAEPRSAPVREFLEGAESPSGAVERHYAEAGDRAEAQERVVALRRALRRAEKRAAGKARKVLASLEESEGWEVWQHMGEGLKAQLSSLKKGTAEAVVADPEEEGEELHVPLDPRKTPVENMQAYFKRARKLKRGHKELEGRLDEAQEELDSLRGGLAALEAVGAALAGGDVEPEQVAAIDRLETWARERGHVRATGAPPGSRAQEPRRIYRRFVSRDGIEIWVGRTDRENDEMTFKAARGEDLFLHVDGRPGSHVIVRLPRGRTLPEETLLDAAELAAHFSAAKEQPKAQVIYTPRKHVKKPRRAPPGQVSVMRERSLLLRRDPNRLKRLLESTQRAEEVFP